MTWVPVILIPLLLAIVFKGHTEMMFDTLSETNAHVKKRFYIPHYFPIQYAGNIGFVSAGIGYQAMKDKYQLSVLYGFSPPSVTGVHIHTVTGKNIFHLYKFLLHEKHVVIPYAALGLSFELGGRSFFIQPDNMPKGYYDFPKSMHVIASAGFKFRYSTNRIKGLRGMEFFAETSTVDVYVWYKVLSDEVKLRDILSMAFGIHFMRK